MKVIKQNAESLRRVMQEPSQPYFSASEDLIISEETKDLDSNILSLFDHEYSLRNIPTLCSMLNKTIDGLARVEQTGWKCS